MGSADGFDFTDFQEEAPQSDDALGELRRLAARQVALTQRQERLAAEAKRVAAELAEVSEKLIPQAMEDLRLKAFETDDGFVLSIEEKVHVSLPKEDQAKRAAAIAWLEANDYGKVIKRQVVIDVGKDPKIAAAVRAALTQAAIVAPVAVISDVHPSTLAALARERYRKRLTMPDAFSPHTPRVAVLEKRK